VPSVAATRAPTGYLGFFNQPNAASGVETADFSVRASARRRFERASGKAGRRTLFAAPVVKINLHTLLHALEVGAGQDARVLRGLDSRQRVRARRGGHRKRAETTGGPTK